MWQRGGGQDYRLPTIIQLASAGRSDGPGSGAGLLRAPACPAPGHAGRALADRRDGLRSEAGALPGPRGGRQRTLGIYEPIHGSAPDIAGKGLANPIGTIASIAMMLRHSLGLEREALAVERAVHEALDAGALTADLAPSGTLAKSTSEVADAVIESLLNTRMAVPA